MQPLLKWVGSKRWISTRIARLVRLHIGNGTYFEPFVGAGSVLFNLDDLDNHKIALDIVEPLIHTYMTIQQNPLGVWSRLFKLKEDGLDPNVYEKRRKKFNDRKISNWEERAAYFIYLNRACYNGLWRTNLNGDFNVPFGEHKSLKLPDQSDFLRTQAALLDVQFQSVLHPRETLILIKNKVQVGDVIFCDPPYLGTFNGYDEFNYSDTAFHEELAETLHEVHKRGAFVIAMNSDTPQIHKWYKPFCHIETIERYQGIAGTEAGRGQWNQILAISNVKSAMEPSTSKRRSC